jgi:hypothetical protein
MPYALQGVTGHDDDDDDDENYFKHSNMTRPVGHIQG